jgi:hypothetical protein
MDAFDFSTHFYFKKPTNANITHNIAGYFDNNGPPPVPIFLIFRDRVSDLIETLRSYHRHIRTPFEIVIFNDNTTFPTAANFLNRLKESGVKVHDNTVNWKETATGDKFNSLFGLFGNFIMEYMKTAPSEYYVLTDPDCALDSAPGNILQVFQALLEEKNLPGVGSAIRWDDWPEHTIKGDYEAAFVTRDAEKFVYHGKAYYYQSAPVDSTFCMYKKGNGYGRDSDIIKARMLSPLAVRHLDFYLDPENLPADYRYYHDAAYQSGVNHMGHLSNKAKL